MFCRVINVDRAEFLDLQDLTLSARTLGLFADGVNAMTLVTYLLLPPGTWKTAQESKWQGAWAGQRILIATSTMQEGPHKTAYLRCKEAKDPLKSLGLAGDEETQLYADRTQEVLQEFLSTAEGRRLFQAPFLQPDNDNPVHTYRMSQHEAVWGRAGLPIADFCKSPDNDNNNDSNDNNDESES